MFKEVWNVNQFNKRHNIITLPICINIYIYKFLLTTIIFIASYGYFAMQKIS